MADADAPADAVASSGTASGEVDAADPSGSSADGADAPADPAESNSAASGEAVAAGPSSSSADGADTPADAVASGSTAPSEADAADPSSGSAAVAASSSLASVASSDAPAGSSPDKAPSSSPAQTESAGQAVALWDDSGTCGEGVTYIFDYPTGELIISFTGTAGTDSGRIYDQFFWNRTFIKTVIIESGVTSIGNETFRECYSLASVIIPNTLTSIGEWAFYKCGSLASVIIPASVGTSIGGQAFNWLKYPASTIYVSTLDQYNLLNGRSYYIDPARTTVLLLVDKPTAETGLVYTGAEQTGVEAGTGYTLVTSGDGASIDANGNAVASDAGSYSATATLDAGRAWNDASPSTDALTLTFTIDKATVDMSQVSFPDGSFAYDGKEHSLVISGALPAGVAVGYLNNSRTEVGSQTATATFDAGSNYYPIAPMTATLEITDNSDPDNPDDPDDPDNPDNPGDPSSPNGSSSSASSSSGPGSSASPSALVAAKSPTSSMPNATGTTTPKTGDNPAPYAAASLALLAAATLAIARRRMA